MAIAFSDYLLGQRGRDDAVGDLARDAARDPEWPKQRGLLGPEIKITGEYGWRLS